MVSNQRGDGTPDKEIKVDLWLPRNWMGLLNIQDFQTAIPIT